MLGGCVMGSGVVVWIRGGGGGGGRGLGEEGSLPFGGMLESPWGCKEAPSIGPSS